MKGPQPGNWFLGWAKLITHYRDQWRITQHWDLQALRCLVQKGRPAVSSDHQHTGYRAPTWAVSPWRWWWELMERAWNVSHHAASFGVTSILAISCPYSRAEHIPCQNSWEISGNCEDPLSGEICISYSLPRTPYLLARTLSTAHVLPQRRSLLSTISGNVIINSVELSKNVLITFLWEIVIYTFQDLKTQFISFQLMFWHAWLAFHQQRHPHLSWHLCGPAKSSAQQDLGTQIIDDPVVFRAKLFHR